ncbi:YibE/F family protein [Candidatus Berkelbacteria bacterium]|nr:YibE/F family protein [Candidatus Berkelbacteria bacterium]
MRNLAVALLLFVLFELWPGFGLAQDEIKATELVPLEVDPAFSQEIPDPEHFRATVIKVDDAVSDQFGQSKAYQAVRLKLESGSGKGEYVDLEHGLLFELADEQKVTPGEQIVATKNYKIDGSVFWTITDKYRLNKAWWLVGIFVVLVIAVARFRGLMSLLGLVASFLILSIFIVPSIIAGRDPALVSLAGSIAIILISIYLSHGFNKQTTVAVVSTSLTLALAVAFSYLAVNWLGLSGVGSEDAYNLQIGLGAIDLKGLLLGGMIIGTLGVLDDITIGQTAIVAELYRANHKLSMGELVRRGLRVGQEHIASLVNTLVLAYAGASMAIFIFIAVSDLPIWVLLNSEFALEEITRALVGSSALILAVPITTWLAAQAVKKYDLGEPVHGHH